ncbi:MAG TPA: transcription elongation factor Spt5 [Nautiliaceae bacterium]|nr:transcription elongation factor Spt5 [Nautiliaceae bacterium]
MSEIYALRVVGGREFKLLENLHLIAKKYPQAIKAVLWKESIKGYLFVETEDLDTLKMIIKSIRDIKNIVFPPIPEKEIEKMLVKEEEEEEILPGDIVEIVVGPFKGEIAKVIRVNKGKKELTVQLLTSTVPIPVDIKLNWVTIKEKVKLENEKNES